MRFWWATALTALLLTGLARAACAEDDPVDRPDIHAEQNAEVFDIAHWRLPCPIGSANLYWARGPTLEASDGRFVLHAGGRIQIDSMWYSQVNADIIEAVGDDWRSGTDIRRAQVFIEGWIGKGWYFKARYDALAGDGSHFQDMYVDWRGPHERNAAIPRLRIGQYKEPVGLEMLTSSGSTTFLEYSLPVRALAPFRNLGAGFMAIPLAERLSVEGGVFTHGAEALSDVEDGSGIDLAGRVVWRRLRDDDPGDVFHVGLSGNIRFGDEDTRFRTVPETNGGPRIVDTGTFRSTDGGLLDIELLWIKDRFSLQAEYLVTAGNYEQLRVSNHGGYVQVSWFLTPDRRNYAPQRSTFSRTEPRQPADLGKSRFCGAWQVAARVSYVDLNDRLVSGGRVGDLTLGLNWYLTDQFRVTFNYVYSYVWNAWGVDGASGPLNAFGTRFQIEW